jgi:Na+/H+-translocating membrane pyrophosphatase
LTRGKQNYLFKVIKRIIFFLIVVSMNILKRVIDSIKCMFGFISGAATIDSGRVELIMTCLVSQKLN